MGKTNKGKSSDQLTFIRLSKTETLEEVLEESGFLKGRDFWIGSVKGVTAKHLPERVVTSRVEGEVAGDIFTDCYFKGTTDIKVAADALVDKFGLGLRKKHVLSPASPGCVYVLINKLGETTIYERRKSYSFSDRRLSSEERLHRCPLVQEEVTMKQMTSQAKKHLDAFYVSAFSNATVADCKKQVAMMTPFGKPVWPQFQRCLIAAVENCQLATQALLSKRGLGLRKDKGHIRPFQGCVVLLLPGADLSLDLDGDVDGLHACTEHGDRLADTGTVEEPAPSKLWPLGFLVVDAAATPTQSKQEDVEDCIEGEQAPPSKKPKISAEQKGKSNVDVEDVAEGKHPSSDTTNGEEIKKLQNPAERSVGTSLLERRLWELEERSRMRRESSEREQQMQEANKKRKCTGEKEKLTCKTKEKPVRRNSLKKKIKQVTNGDENDSEYDRNMRTIERTLSSMLPTLNEKELASTTLVQRKLEVVLKKPAGHLDHLRKEIGRIRHQRWEVLKL